MRYCRLAASSLIAGAALALTACGGGGTANNTADNASLNGIGESADPGAVETIGNGAEGGNGTLGGADGAGDGTGSGSANGSAGNSGAGADSGAGPSGTGNPGGDTGGNAAGGTNNGM
ncbi:MAG TPA: hypothetical protein VF702_14815 [Allosphingosinicella sp.]